MSIATTLAGIADHFERVNVAGLNFEAECFFATMQIEKNKYTAEIAAKNPNSLADAMLSVGAVGLTLSPASALCYLVPRDGKIVLDMSYRGLVRLATDAGSILMVKAVLVYESDKFTWRGPAEMPIHDADVFSAGRFDAQQPLKSMVGGYCVAWLPGGAVMIETMSASEIMAIKNASKSDKGPWAATWAGEMAKKTLIKRAAKSWPSTPSSARLDAAISVDDDADRQSAEAAPPPPNSQRLDFAATESKPTPAPAAALASARKPVEASPPPAATQARKPAATLIGVDGKPAGDHTTPKSFLDALESLAVSAGPTLGHVILGHNDAVLQRIGALGVFDERILRIRAAVATAAAPADAAPQDDVF